MKSTVINNGNTCDYRQDCPISAFLFIIAIEILANNLRHDKDIKGIEIDNNIIKISRVFY